MRHPIANLVYDSDLGRDINTLCPSRCPFGARYSRIGRDSEEVYPLNSLLVWN